MKKLLFIFSLLLVTVIGNATPIFDWNTFFATSATGNGVLETGTSGVINTWYNGSVTGGANPTLVTPSDLSYTDGTSTNYIDNIAGKAVYINSPLAARNSIYYLTSTGYTTGTYYVSFLLNVATGTAPLGTTVLMNFNQSSTGSSQYGRIYIKQSSSAGFVLTTNSYNGVVSSPTVELTYGTTHLIILKFVMAATPSVQASLFTDPTLGGTEGTAVTAPAYTTTALTVKGLVIQSIPSFNGKIAGLRLSSTWADAAKGKLATPSVATGANPITSGGFTANWAAVSNASSYTLTVYNSNGTTNQTIPSISSSATSYDVIGLSPTTSYSYKVTAVGNGTTFINSEQSLAASFSTSASVVPVLSVDAISGSFGGQVINSTTGPNSFTITGALLTTENVTVSALSGYSYSTTAGGTYTSSLSLPQLGGTFSQQIFVKFTPTSYSSYNGNIVVGGGGVGASTVNCAVTGSGIYAEPTSQASGLTFSSINATGFTINWNAGNGTNSLVVVKAASAVDSNPVDVNSYTANTTFGSGSQLGTGNYVIYNSTGNSVAVTGLTKGTKYYVSVYSYNGSGGAENYLTSSSAMGSQLAAITITSNGSGGGVWANGGSWNGGTAPGQFDNVTVLSGDVIDVTTTSQKCNNLTINFGGKVWANTAGQMLSVYGTYLVCDGTFGDSNNALTTGSQLVLGYGNIIDITGTGSIYPYKIQPVTGMTPIGVIFDANVTATYGTAGVQTDNTGNTNVTLYVSANKTLTVAGNMTTTGSATAVGTGNVTIDVYGTINITGALNTAAAIGKTSTLTVYSGGLITAGKFALSPTHQVQAATYTVNLGGEIKVTGTTSTAVDCSHTTITSSVIGGGAFTTTSAGSTVALGNASGLNATTGPIRTSTRNFDTNTNFSFIGTSAQATGSYLPSTVNNLTINNAAGVTLSGPTNVNGALNLTAGTFNNTTYNVTLGNIATISRATGSLAAVPVFGSTVNLTYSGSAAVTPANEFPVSAAITTLTVNNTAGLSLTSNLSTVTNLTIGTGGILNVNAGKQLSVNTTLLNSGTLNLLSDNSNGTATILTPTTITGTGTTNVQQYLGTARNWYVSSPVSNALAPAGYSYYKRDEAAASWTSSPFVTGDAFVAGTGYVALPDASNATITFTTQTGGSLNTGDVPVSLTWAGASSKGFNLIGNPYPSHLTMTKAFTDANNQLIEPTIWYRTNAGAINNSGQWSFQTYNAFSGEGLLGGTELIPPMQAFWVKAIANGTLTLDNKLTRSHQSSNPLKAPAVSGSLNQKLRLQITNGISLDEALIYFNPDAINTLDAYDSPKMTNGIASIPEIYTEVGGEQLAINGMSSISNDTEIALGFNTGQAGTFTIKASQISNFDPSVIIYLKDNNDLINTPVLLNADATYTFSSDITTNNTSRFTVLFKAPSIATGINQNGSANVMISTNANNQIVVNGGGSVAIYNAIGQKLSAKNLTATTTVIETPLQSGVYFVSLKNAGKSITQKVIIK